MAGSQSSMKDKCKIR